MRLIALTIFLSSLLLFQVQPLMGKYILPWFGGAPDVWTACMLFFQMTLLGGYGYAHFIVRHFVIKQQVVIHTVALLISFIWLPVTPPDFLKPDEVALPVVQVLLVLLVSVGGPFLLVSSTAPLIQSWYSRAYPGHSPYRLYALSNTGSLLGLFGYPFVIERVLRLPDQTLLWSTGYFIFIILCISTGWWVRKKVGDTGNQATELAALAIPEPDSQPARKRRLIDVFLWLALSFSGSVMLLSVTNQLCLNVAAVPFLWVLPLGIYLSTFILCFDSDRWYRRGLFAFLWIGMLGLGLGLGFGASFSLGVQIACYCFILFVCCMVCHGELSLLRPDPKELTFFFFMVSIGGLFGGLFVALVAPAIFNYFYEFYVGLIGSGFALLLVLRRDFWLTLDGAVLVRSMSRTAAVGVAVLFIVMGVSKMAGQAGLGGGANTIAVYRDFYGVVSVQREETTKPGDSILALTHGNTTHGFQFEAPEKRADLVGYYQENSGIGLAFRYHPRRLRGESLRVGILGLGAGTLAVYAQPGDEFVFYELDPNVEWFARQMFTNLYDAEERGASVEVILGDGRITMERQLKQGGSGQYDILVFDAFSSDAIPVHLLTEEAFALYRKHLNPGGVLAIHVSNRYLNLSPVVRSSLKHIKLDAGQFWHLTPAKSVLPEKFKFTSHWILASDNESFLEQPEIARALTSWEDEGNLIQWTDNFSSLFQVLSPDR